MPKPAQSEQLPSRAGYAKSDDTRARILDATLAQARESGLQNTSVAKIAARAGVAIGILNYHFGSKKKLLRELMSALVEDLLSRLSAPDEGEDFFTYEKRLLLTYLEFLHANPAYVRLTEEIRHLDPELYRAGTEANIEHLCARISTGIGKGHLRAMSDAEIRAQAYFMLGAFTFLDRVLEDDSFTDDAAVATSYINLLRTGLAS